MAHSPKSWRSMLIAGSLIAGVGIGAAGIASASTGSTTSIPAASSPGIPPNSATMTHGPGETILSGDSLAKATAAADAAEPGASIIRIETDSSGAAYEAHMTKADGSIVTVKMDANYKVTGIEDAFGTGPNGAGIHGPGPMGSHSDAAGASNH
jgi:hypothetical protein